MFPVFEYEMHVVFSIFSSYDSCQVSFLQTERMMSLNLHSKLKVVLAGTGRFDRNI